MLGMKLHDLRKNFGSFDALERKHLCITGHGFTAISTQFASFLYPMVETTMLSLA